MISWYVDKLFTKKMGTLVSNKINDESDHYKRHYLHLMLIAKRPRNWENMVAEYILSIDKNSFYLLDTINCLSAEYKYSYTTSKNVNNLSSLIKLCTGMHNPIFKKLSLKKAKNLPDSCLPERQV